MKNPVYLDYNATTPIDLEVADEMLPYIRSSFGNPSSSYSPGRINREAINMARQQVYAHTLASMIASEVYISTGSACHAGSGEISPVLKAMNVDIMTAACTVRISTGKYTNDKEIDLAIEAISDKVLKLKS